MKRFDERGSDIIEVKPDRTLVVACSGYKLAYVTSDSARANQQLLMKKQIVSKVRGKSLWEFGRVLILGFPINRDFVRICPDQKT